MYHKIASLMLNIGKTPTGHREVFVAQPDAVTENLAGKVFILAEIDGKKNEGKQIMEFLIKGISEHYYQDEKIFLRDKIEGLELENIFEASLTKLNRSLNDFLLTEKIKISPLQLNITIGLVFENKLMFSNFGKNKSFLIFRKQDKYEIINVEASASEVVVNQTEEESPKDKQFKVFSSVVNGEIPVGSYFFFANETLPEYLSNRELVLIITKLPPIVAAEQMRQSLAKVNTFVPFLGVIIKNTTILSGQEKEEFGDNLSAQSSISNLNYTEKKTEAMLAPAGLINWQKFGKRFNAFWLIVINSLKQVFTWQRPIDKKVKAAIQEKNKQGSLSQERETRPVLDVKDKILVARPRGLITRLGSLIVSPWGRIFRVSFWSGWGKKINLWRQNLQPKHQGLIIIVILLAIVLIISLSLTANKNRQQAQNEEFIKEIANLESRFDLISSYFLYGNEDGAKIIIGELTTLLDGIEIKTDEQQEIVADWRSKLQAERQKIQRLTIIEEADLIFDARDSNPSAEPRNLLLAANNLYITDPAGKIIYTYNLETQATSSILISGLTGEIDLNQPVFYNNRLTYLNNDNLITINSETGQSQSQTISSLVDRRTTKFDIFTNNLLYTLHPDENLILRHSPAPSYSQSSSWLNTELDLSRAVDMVVTGEIWLLNSDASLWRLYLNEQTDFQLASIDPPLNSANKLLVSSDELYVFSFNDRRLAVYNRPDGKFLAQYQLPDLGTNILDIAFDFDQQKIYLLTTTRLYLINLN